MDKSLAGNSRYTQKFWANTRVWEGGSSESFQEDQTKTVSSEIVFHVQTFLFQPRVALGVKGLRTQDTVTYAPNISRTRTTNAWMYQVARERNGYVREARSIEAGRRSVGLLPQEKSDCTVYGDRCVRSQWKSSRFTAVWLYLGPYIPFAKIAIWESGMEHCRTSREFSHRQS